MMSLGLTLIKSCHTYVMACTYPTDGSNSSGYEPSELWLPANLLVLLGQ